MTVRSESYIPYNSTNYMQLDKELAKGLLGRTVSLYLFGSIIGECIIKEAGEEGFLVDVYMWERGM